jgi:hypothetical protein
MECFSRVGIVPHLTRWLARLLTRIEMRNQTGYLGWERLIQDIRIDAHNVFRDPKLISPLNGEQAVRIATRNLINHQRRQCRWWRGISLYCWLGQDGRVRGIVALGSITSEEFEEAFRRWEPDLKRIAEEELANEVYAAMGPEGGR